MFTDVKAPVPYVKSDLIPDIFAHCFTTRLGGVSSGYLSSLNLGVSRGDGPENVKKNYKLICDACGFDSGKLVFFHQIHSRTVLPVTLDDAFAPYERDMQEADGAVTDEAGVTLAVFTADCVPILLCDEKRRAIGAVHAGWRGTMLGIAGEGVRALIENYGCKAENIRAAIGASIGSCCFETNSDVPEAAEKLLGGEARRFIVSRGNGKYLVDLRGINRRVLELAGVKSENIDVSGECTVCNCDKYWSHRVTNGRRGVQAAMIMLKR